VNKLHVELCKIDRIDIMKSAKKKATRSVLFGC